MPVCGHGGEIPVGDAICSTMSRVRPLTRCCHYQRARLCFALLSRLSAAPVRLMNEGGSKLSLAEMVDALRFDSPRSLAHLWTVANLGGPKIAMRLITARDSLVTAHDSDMVP